MTETLKQKADDAFRSKYGTRPIFVVQAPGRVNLIGEHTDYSEGFVMPVAVDLGVAVAFHPREDELLRLYSIDYNKLIEVDLTNFTKGEAGWQEYVKGIAWALTEEGIALTGWDGVVVGNVPIGAGLSSSAALEIALAKVFSLTSKFEKSPAELAVIGQRAENHWVGVNVGIMDQLISASGKRGFAVQIDCRSLEYEYVQIPEGVSFMVLDTGTRRKLTNSAYNARREECQAASKILGVATLRDANITMLEDKKDQMPGVVYKRARHVIGENNRVHAFNSAMGSGDLQEIGKLINKSHKSLNEDYEVSSRELNVIVEIAQSHPACLGARMTGAGFGGCALAVIAIDKIEEFSEAVHLEYHKKTGIEPNIFSVESADGVQVL